LEPRLRVPLLAGPQGRLWGPIVTWAVLVDPVGQTSTVLCSVDLGKDSQVP
jgi:hypothetical protein